MNTAITGSSSPQQRTFDCPWCGAINPVPSDHMGEHFPCPECRKTTKLTEKNTSAGRPTEAPPDAPHLSGDRTFDCPWCGAIASVPSSHLGERFHCPECKRETRLTSTNTRRAPITAPPPDAPPPVPKASRAGLWVVVGLAAVGAVAWAVASGGSGGAAENKGDAGTATATDTAAVSPPTSRAAPATPAATGTSGASPAPAAGTSPAGMEPSGTPAEPVPAAPPAGEAAALAAAQGALGKAAADLAQAETALADAHAKYEAWTKDNPDIVEKEGQHAAIVEVGAEMKRLVAATPSLAEPAKTTPEQARAFDAAVVAFVKASPARAAVVEQALERMRQEFVGRGLSGDWKAIEFHGPAFARAQAALDEAFGGMAGLRPPELAKGVADAESAVAAARKAKADAEARLAAPKPASK